MCDVAVEFCTQFNFYPSSEEQSARGLDHSVLGEFCVRRTGLSVGSVYWTFSEFWQRGRLAARLLHTIMYSLWSSCPRAVNVKVQYHNFLRIKKFNVRCLKTWVQSLHNRTRTLPCTTTTFNPLEFRGNYSATSNNNIWNWRIGRWWVGCYIWYSEEGTGRGRSARPGPSSLYQM